MTNAITFEAITERVDAAKASVGEVLGESGYSTVRQRYQRDPARQKRVAAAVQLLERAKHDPVWGRAMLQEAMSTSDFPALFGDALDRQLYRAYEATMPSWRSYCRRATVPDFREVKRFATSSFRGLLPRVKERGNYSERSTDEFEYRYAVQKYGALVDISWETLINDDLGALDSAPQDLSQSVIDSQEAFVAEVINDGLSNPGLEVNEATNFFHADHDNLTSDLLDRDALNDAVVELRSRRDDNNNPIVIRAMTLVVPPSLTDQANEILDTREYRVADGDNTRIISGNGVYTDLRVETNYWLPTYLSAGQQNAWFLFASPSSARPAIEVGFLRGNESPALYERASNQSPDDGFSFEDDSRAWKVRTVHGGGLVDPRMAYASTGDGS